MEEDQKRQKGRIRLMEVADLDAVAKIWLDVNRQAHDFIPAAYWEENFAAVKEMLPSAEVYVWEEKSGAGNPGSQIEDSKAELQGFIGLNGEDIEGIFVRLYVYLLGNREVVDGFCEIDAGASAAACGMRKIFGHSPSIAGKDLRFGGGSR